MGNIVNIRSYRKKRSVHFKDENKTRLFSFFETFIQDSIPIRANALRDWHQRNSSAQQGWDYLDLRVLIEEIIEREFLGKMWDELTQQKWFNKKLFSKEDAINIATHMFLAVLHENSEREFEAALPAKKEDQKENHELPTKRKLKLVKPDE